MPKEILNSSQRTKRFIIIIALTAIILIVATYAWFIGLQSVNVNSFDVEIKTTDSLMLSLDGVEWEDTITISKEDLENANEGVGYYSGHTNSWGGDEGLIPMSSVGEMDLTYSRLKLYEKASLTATPGGYRLMASRVKNYGVDEEANPLPEQKGYVVFDLFVKNFSGTQYLEALNELDEEAIYLTIDSEVKVSSAGVQNTGIENSVRVAFAQIGRVAGTTEEATTIQGISCNEDEDGEPSVVDGVTGICRTAQIWEPNDRNHVDAAINWYQTSCLKRTGSNVTLKTSYATNPVVKCGKVIDGIAYPTYAVSEHISSANHVDIYDGAVYNTYDDNDPDTTWLESYPYFTDTMKLLTGTNRPPFMTLAPNSITKIRVYIYIEGQDIDNYDFAQIGKAISIKFGFTKERFTEDDIDYEGPDLNKGEGPNGDDKTPPVITLVGNNPLEIEYDSTFTDPGATAEDNVDGEITEIEMLGTVNTKEPGTYLRIYKVKDSAGNLGTKTRTVVVLPEE